MGGDAARDGWRSVRFGDVVRQVKETASDPEGAGFTRVVGLNHLDSDSLRVTRWNNLANMPDGTSFTRIFRAGQVLFGKRRAYQRKVAVTEFDGVCSGDILVFESSSAELLPDFLPYLVQSDGFFDHALGTSAGSLSPRTKWQDLSRYEFELPPLSHQALAVEILGATREVAESVEAAAERLNELVEGVISGHYRTLSDAAPAALVTEMAVLTMGRQKAPKYDLGSNPTPYVRVANVGHLELLLDELEVMDFDAMDLARFRLKPGDVLLTEGDIVSPLNVGRSAVFPEDGPTCCFQNTLIRLRATEDIDPTYLMAMIEGARLSGVLAATANTTTVSHLGLRRLSEVRLPLANAELQRQIGAEVTSLLAFRTKLRDFRNRTSPVDRALRDRLMKAGA
ncbi:MAG: hypothetical protein WD598_00960 [Acidimicrobiia bacterium]